MQYPFSLSYSSSLLSFTIELCWSCGKWACIPVANSWCKVEGGMPYKSQSIDVGNCDSKAKVSWHLWSHLSLYNTTSNSMLIMQLYACYSTPFYAMFPIFQDSARFILMSLILVIGYSKGRSGHIPFRDSKLTRILQSSLGGNSRTAIICTMSPARSHVEQSRNTLLFASCAKEVSTNAQVNTVISDKALVKHLQRELDRLENELRSPASKQMLSDTAALLLEKDHQIETVIN